MSTQYGGLPANIELNLPDAVDISSTTNATPIVVTTATAHGCSTGDYLITINAADPEATGAFRAGSVTSTTIALLTLDGFTTTGSLAGGAQGTLQQAGFGTTYAIPSDGDSRAAASVGVPLEALGDRTAWLQYFVNFGRKRRRARILLPSAGPHTIDVTQADIFELDGTPTSPPVDITLASVTPVVPGDSERIQLIVPSGLPGAAQYTIRRVDTTIIATIVGEAASLPGAWAEFEFTGGVWRLAGNSGTYISAGTRGVVPGAGA